AVWRKADSPGPRRKRPRASGQAAAGGPSEFSQLDADVLRFGEEVERIEAALAADAALLHPAKGNAEVSQQPRVDPHRPAVDGGRDAVRLLEVPRPDARRESVPRAVGVRDRFVGRIEGRDGDDWSEDLLLHDAPAAVEARDHCRLQEVAAADALGQTGRTVSARENGALLLLRERDITLDLAKVRLADERAHVGRIVLRISDPQLLGRPQEAVEELVVNGLLDEHPRAAEADLPLVGEARLDRGGDGLVEVGVRE